ncbi:MAG: HdeD family acid-resistance protein [Anaerolineales bacterium]
MDNLIQGKWTTLVLRGVLALILGALMFLNLNAGALAVLVIFGVYAILDGIFKLGDVYAKSKANESYRHTLLAAAVSIIIGIMIFAWPRISAVLLIALLAAHILVQGVVDIYEAVRARRSLGRSRLWLLVIGGMAQLLFGIWMIAQPVLGGLTIIAVIAAYAMVIGVILIIRGVEQKAGGSSGPVAFA